MKKQCEFLIFEIETYFNEGIVLDDDICHFIRSTFSDPEVNGLDAIINDPDNSERDSLLELIFFPDEAMQIRMEDLLSGEWFNKDDEDDLAAGLASKEPYANVYISGRNQPFPLKMPASYAHKLVSHLRVTKRIDPRILDAVRQHIPENIQGRVKVRLRNSDFEESENKTTFLCKLFRAFNGQKTVFLSALDFVLLFFTEIPPDASVGYSLAVKKRYVEEKIREAVTYEEQLKKSNMETMMMQGRRNQCVNVVDLQEKIDMINYLQNMTRAVHE